MAQVEAFINELHDVNSVEDSNEAPVDTFLSNMPGNLSYPECALILKVFARRGARACPQLHRQRLWDAFEDYNAEFLELLLGSFLGVSQGVLIDIMQDTITHLCCQYLWGSAPSEKELSPTRKRLVDMAVLLMKRIAQHCGATDAVSSFFYSLPHSERRRCPEELVSQLGLKPCNAVLPEPFDAKLLREVNISTTCLRKHRRQSHMSHKVVERKIRSHRSNRKGDQRKCDWMDFEAC
jgi:hypothetical protein